MTKIVPWPQDVGQRYRDAGYWTGQTFGALLTERAAQHALRTAVVGDSAEGPVRWTYATLDDRAHRLAAGLHDVGLRPGDRVLLQLPNVAEFLEAVFALFRLGAWPVFALPAHRQAEMRYFAEHTDAVAYVTVGQHNGFDHARLARQVAAAVPSLRHIVDVEHLEQLRAAPCELPDPDPSGVALLQLSGGSTGLPKLIPRTHDDYLYSARASAEICGLTPESVYLAALPVAHNYPLSSPGVLGALHAGATTVLAPRPDPETAFGLIAAERVTITGVVPPLAAIWVRAASRTCHDLSSLQVLQVGGAKCGVELARRIRPALGCAVQQVFGMAEGLVNYTRLDDPEELVLHTQGRPISPADEVRVVDAHDRDLPDGEVGALLTRGPYTIRGYYDASEHNATAFTPDGFYRTGDLVSRNPLGYLVVQGRVKEQINRGGDKIAAEEVEDHLMAHPRVLDAAIVAVPDQFLGERTCAYVIPTGDPTSDMGTAPTAEELRAFVRSRGVAAFKVPDLVEVVTAFPVTGAGKINRRELRAALAVRHNPVSSETVER